MEKASILTTKVQVQDLEEFSKWQALFNSEIARFGGFVSLEVLQNGGKWVIVQRFVDQESMRAWKMSKERCDLLQGVDAEDKEKCVSDMLEGGVTEVFIIEVKAGDEGIFREWIAKMHQEEVKFKGFRGVYVQSPKERGGKNWITLLQFDTPENLDRWLESRERKEMLKIAEPLICAVESHRMLSSYAGWFASIKQEGESVAAWKQAMVVLLVLFPIVMVQMKFLSPVVGMFDRSIATFIGNVVSVAFITWFLMPVAIRCLKWWLLAKKRFVTLAGSGLMLLLYGIEVWAFFEWV